MTDDSARHTDAAPADAPTILVVDDVAANRVAMRHLLKGVGAHIREAGSGEEALAACLEQHFALILLDVQMPGMDGFEVAELLSGQGELSDTPVIFVTAAHTDEVDRLMGYKLGAVDYVTKPVNPTILRAKINAFLELHRSRAQIQRLLRDFEHVNLRLQREVEDRKKAEAEARHQAHHDPLTGLPNRTHFYQRLAQDIAQPDARLALIYIDLDGFKQVNDHHGHAAGDALLVAVAGRLRHAFRAADLVARLGGDEFAVLLATPAGDVELAERLARMAVESLARPFRLDLPEGGIGVEIGASAGLALAPEDAASVDALVAVADQAMYAAKRAGKGRVLRVGGAAGD